LQRDAASVLFNLPGYRVVDASDGLPRALGAAGGRRVLVESVEVEGGCPSCVVLTSRVHQVTLQRVRDVPVAGALEMMWRKRRFVCDERLCPRRTFAEHTVQVPPRARTTGRLLDDVLAAVTSAGRTVSEVAAAHQVAWWTVQTVVNAAAVLLAATPAPAVRRLGIDEHRYRSVKFFRDPATNG
jgi:transposase